MAGVKGNRGGGRKGKYQEKADAEKLFSAFFGDNTQEVLESKVRSGVFSIWDRVVLTAMEGDTKILQALMAKAFPDSLNIHGDVIVPVTIKRQKPKA